MDVRLPNGTIINNVPDGTTQTQLRDLLGKNGQDLDALFTPAKPFFTASEPKKEQAGFFSSLYEQATALGLADEAAAFTANPTEENRKAFIDAGILNMNLRVGSVWKEGLLETGGH